MISTRMKNRSTQSTNPCIWMQAGVVKKKSCERNYDCTQCPFDRALRQAAEENQRLDAAGRGPKGKRAGIVSWKERMRELPPKRRPCLHHMKARIGFTPCFHDYHCGRCDFDQYFQDQYAVHAVVKPIDILDIHGFHVPQGYYLHRGHSWAKMEEGESVRIGIDEFALKVLGPFDCIESPLLGKVVKQNEPALTGYRGRLAARVLSPVSGVVTAIRTELREDGGLAGTDPFGEGWVMTVHAIDLRGDLKTLMIHEETRQFMEQEVESLTRLIEETTGPMAADGGHLGEDLYGKMPQLGWENLTKRFLHT